MCGSSSKTYNYIFNPSKSIQQIFKIYVAMFIFLNYQKKIFLVIKDLMVLAYLIFESLYLKTKDDMYLTYPIAQKSIILIYLWHGSGDKQKKNRIILHYPQWAKKLLQNKHMLVEWNSLYICLTFDSPLNSEQFDM